MLVLLQSVILQPKNRQALQNNFFSIFEPSLARFFSSLVLSSRVRLASLILLSFSQMSAHIPRISPIFLDFGHPNRENASFSENNP